MAEAGDRSQPATPRRRQEARREGNIARSPDLSAAGTLTVGIIALHILGMHIFGGLRTALETTLGSGFSANSTRSTDTSSLGAYCLSMLLHMAGPVILCVATAALLITMAQVGLVFTLKPLQFNLAKLNPLRGLGNIFNMRGSVRLVMSVAKLALIGTVAGLLVWRELPRIFLLAELDLLPMFGSVCEMVYDLALKLALAAACWACCRTTSTSAGSAAAICA